MRIILTLFFLCFLGFYKAQEKRIALVIGNAEYVHASPLKNPVNDAELMKSTLISLGFDVIMANNIKTERQFLDTLRSFQRKSAAYNVRFLYYAGHAVQIGEENFLLPTEEKFEIKTDFSDYAIPLSKITTAFTQVENEINIVILDACRDNPFKNVSESRGVIVENLLNEQSSDGVLIAYATTSGSTASDGLKESKNSVFCTSLAKNMMFPDIPFEDVLKKVRIDVKQALNQKPEYRNSLENTLYLKKSTYTNQIIEIDSLINAEDYELAKEKVIEVLTKAPDYKLALLRRGRIEYNLKNKDYNGSHLFKADSLYPNDPHIHEYLGRYYSTIGEIEKAIKSMNEAIDLDSQDPDLFYWRARFFEKNNEFQNAESDYTKSIMLDSTVKRFVKRSEFFFQFKEYELALKDYTKVIALDKENPESYAARAECYIAMKENTAALKDLDKAIDLDPKNPNYYNDRADFYSDYHQKEKDDLALKDYATALDISTDTYETLRALNNRALIFQDQEKFDLALEEYNKAIDKSPEEPLIYSNRANIYKIQEKYELAILDFTNVIALDKENPESYAARAQCYIAMKENTAALKDLDKAIDLDPKNPGYYNDRADFYSDYYQKEKDDLALKDYATALDISTDTYETLRALNNRALIFQDQEKFDLALEEYNKAIDISPKEPKPYSNKAEIYTILEKYELAILEFTNIIALDKENPESYAARAECYIAMKENTAALKDLDKAIDLDPKKPNYYNNRADYYREYKNEPELALKDYATALDISTDTYETIRALKRRALIFQIQEKYDLALEEYNKAIDMSPDEPYIYSIRALIFQIQEKYELALKDYTQAIELEPTNPNGYADRASFYKEVLKRPYDALVDYSLAISLDSTDINLWWYRGKLFSEELNNQELAIKDFNQILKIKPNDINALNWTAIFYDRNNDVSNAIIGYMKIISLGDSIKKLEYKIEDYGWANINLAEIYQCENKVEEAMNLYNEGVTYMPEYEEAYYWRSWFFALYLKKYEDAIADFSKAIKLDPKNPYWLLNRSKIYHMKGDLKSAKSDMNDAVKISNESAIYIAERGNFYSVTGEFDKATKDFKESIKLDSLSRRTFHYLTENLIRQGKIDDALKNASESMTKFKNDTISFEQIGRINFAKNDLFKSLSAYTQAASIMEFNEGDRTIYPHDIQVFLSDVYVKIAEIYEKLNQSDLKCEFLNKAKDTVIFETRPDRQKMIKEIREKLIFYQN